jgi:guanylate kinase
VGESGNIFVVCAPSGAGKRTVLNRVMAGDENLALTVSVTTRPPRDGETGGVEYEFVSNDEFEDLIADDQFVEWARVHDNLYGTRRTELERVTADGKDALLELDVQGMRNVRNAGIDAITIFIAPPNIKELERRIRARGADSDSQIALRMANARDEMAARGEFDHVIVNDDLEEAVEAVRSIIAEVRAQ